VAVRRYLVVSDLHLADVEDHADGWKAHKASRHLFDRDLQELVVRALDGLPPGAAFTLVLNGDILDFDLVDAVPPDPPWPVHRTEYLRGLHANAAKSAWKCRRMLEHHPAFVQTLARVLCRCHEVVYVLGNHDREFHFPEVRQVFVDALVDTVRAGGGDCDPRSIRFEPWFFLREGEVYAEHGNQYDYYNSFRWLLHPLVHVHGEDRVALPMGNLSNRYLLTRMGFFNPHATDYILNVFAYLEHWLRHYAFTRRSLVGSWLWGSIVVMQRLLRQKKCLRKAPEGYGGRMQEAADRQGLPLPTVKSLARLQRPDMTSRFYRIVREFWIDRLAIATLMIGGTITLALVPIPLWIQLMVPLAVFPLIFFIYERAVRGEDVFTVERQLPTFAGRIAQILPVRLVTMGHTHRPGLVPLARGVSFANTGTWAPVGRWTDSREPPGYRNYLLADFDGAAEPAVTLGSFGQAVAYTSAQAEAPGPEGR
jgi:UDP-2,3-diacylglucosamine pyrophosphatase LpxH